MKDTAVHPVTRPATRVTVVATPVVSSSAPYHDDSDRDKWKRLQEEHELMEKNITEMKELERKHEEDMRAAEAAEEKAERERKMAEPLRHAEWVSKNLPQGVSLPPIYYIDSYGNQQQLGIVPRVSKRSVTNTTRRLKKRIVQRMIRGPSLEHKLEVGEEELVDVVVWV